MSTADRTPDEFVAWDLETTGLDVSKDDIVEIGAVRFRGGVPVDEFRTYVALPEGAEIPPEASRVNGIYKETLEGAPSAREAIESLVRFVGGKGTFVVGHNIDEYDIPLLLIAAGRAAVRPETADAIGGWVPVDTRRVARARVSDAPNYRLVSLAAHLGIPHDKAHSALEDARASGHLLVRLLQPGEGLAQVREATRWCRGGPAPAAKTSTPLAVPYAVFRDVTIAFGPEGRVFYISEDAVEEEYAALRAFLVDPKDRVARRKRRASDMGGQARVILA